MPLDLHAFLLGCASLAEWAQFKGTGHSPAPSDCCSLSCILKHMTKQTKLRIDNVTAKEALKSESVDWVLKKNYEKRLEVS
jgi:hypothetical protein